MMCADISCDVKKYESTSEWLTKNIFVMFSIKCTGGLELVRYVNFS